jgi:D-alanyl-D-alanine carboxypeptidase
MPTDMPHYMRNGRYFDAVPASLYSAKSNRFARRLAQSEWLIRDKRDGSYIATLTKDNLDFFHRSTLPSARIDAISELLFRSPCRSECLSFDELDSQLGNLGIRAESYSADTGLLPVTEPLQLEFAGFDRYQRPLWLDYEAARGWRRMKSAAANDGIFINAVSGFRSFHYQMGIFQRKLSRGLELAEILKVNAAPGFSEHHSGRAIDIGTPDEPPAEESFEHTPAFRWLTDQAGKLGFRMSFPRNNPHGIGYEPWHWYWQGNDQS